MTTAMQSSRRRTIQFALSIPVQSALFLSLTSITLWTIYFSPYTPAHNTLHETRHSMLGVGCH